MDWQQIVYFIILTISVSGVAIQIGMLRNQIMINTVRLSRLEEKMEESNAHNANTNARWPDLERRLNRLESIVNHITIPPPKN